jgi:hypothetical protein
MQIGLLLFLPRQAVTPMFAVGTEAKKAIDD